MNIGEKIKNARKNKRLTQTQLAKLVGVKSATVVSSWESGQSSPTTMATVKNLCTTLDLTPCDFFGMIPDTCNVISSDDKEILSKMRFLDSVSKNKILEVINREYARCTTPYTSDPVLFQIEISYPIFLTKDDPDYVSIQKNVKELKKESKKRKYLPTPLPNFFG